MVRRPLGLACLIYILFVFLIGAGGNLMEGNNSIRTKTDLPYGTEIQLTGMVVGKEIKYGTSIIYLKDITFCDNSYQNINFLSTNRIICNLQQMEMPAMGTMVTVRGILEEFNTATNPGEFDLSSYYHNQGYIANIKKAEIVWVSQEYDWLRETLYQIRAACCLRLDYLLKEEDSSIMKAMLFGDKTQMNSDTKELYQSSGIGHILAISGLHVSIIGIGLYQLLKRLAAPLSVSTFAPVGVMLCYMIMTGSGTSTIRAVIMFIFMVMALWFRKSYDLMTAMLVAAALTATIDYHALLQPGFWLSYGAVFGISVLYPSLVRSVEVDHQLLKKLLSTVLGSVSINLITLPIILSGYYEYPLYSIFINFLILPFMSILMIAGLVTLLLGWISIPLGQVAGYLVHGILWLFQTICQSFQKIPGRSWIAGKPDLWKIVIYCFLMGILVVQGSRIGKKRVRAIPFRFRMILICLAILILGLPTDRQMRITFLDVGQGDGICIQYEESVYMIDGGSSSEKKLLEYTLVPFLKYHGIDTISCWMISHPDEDHCSGLIEILQNGEKDGIRIESILLPAASGISQRGEEIIRLANENHIPVGLVARGDAIQDGYLQFLFLHPEENAVVSDMNATSMVIYLKYGDFTALFTGDATVESEKEVLEYLQNDFERSSRCSDDSLGNDITMMMEHPDDYFDNSRMREGGQNIFLLKVGHHGSSGSSGMDFLEYWHPQIAVISCGENNERTTKMIQA